MAKLGGGVLRLQFEERFGHAVEPWFSRVFDKVRNDWRLNERHYGGLTGLDKAETAAKHGDDQVKIWRRSFDIPPPPLEAGSEWSFDRDARYAGQAIPDTESLKTTLDRVLPYWDEAIAPRLRAGAPGARWRFSRR